MGKSKLAKKSFFFLSPSLFGKTWEEDELRRESIFLFPLLSLYPPERTGKRGRGKKRDLAKMTPSDPLFVLKNKFL